MLLANFCVAGMTATIRVASHELHPFEIAFFRNLFGFVFVLPFLWRAGLGMLRAHAPGRLLVSSGGHLVAMLCYFLAVAYMPLAELTALAFTKPLFATLGAALVLHEVVRGRRWSAIAIGFVGVHDRAAAGGRGVLALCRPRAAVGGGERCGRADGQADDAARRLDHDRALPDPVPDRACRCRRRSGSGARPASRAWCWSR